MSSEDDFDDEDRDKDEDERGDEDEDFDGSYSIPEDGFILAGMECLNDMNVRAANFIRSERGPSLDVQYALCEDSLEMLGASFDRYFSQEAYLTLTDFDDNRRGVVIMKDLRMVHMELGTDVNSEDEMCVHLSYNIGTFEIQIIKKTESET